MRTACLCLIGRISVKAAAVLVDGVSRPHIRESLDMDGREIALIWDSGESARPPVNAARGEGATRTAIHARRSRRGARRPSSRARAGR